MNAIREKRPVKTEGSQILLNPVTAEYVGNVAQAVYDLNLLLEDAQLMGLEVEISVVTHAEPAITQLRGVVRERKGSRI